MASLAEALDIAIAWEEYAREGYERWADATGNLNAKALFRNLASMEARHARMLRGVKGGGDLRLALSGSEWLDLSGGMAAHPAAGDRDLKAVFEYAMKKELEANARYAYLAGMAKDASQRELFTLMANEEAYHRTLINEQYVRLLKAV